MVVYKITNKINGKAYVGVTAQEPSVRWYQHRYSPNDLNSGKSTCRALASAINKYGKDNFTFEVIAQALSKAELGDLEDLYIKQFNTMAPNGYNLKTGGYEGNSYSLESREKNRQAHLGRKHKPEAIQKLSEAFSGEKNPFYGKTHSEEVKKFISDLNKNRVRSPEEIENHRKWAASRVGLKRDEGVLKKTADSIRARHMLIPKYLKDPDGFIWSTGSLKIFAETHSLSFRALQKVRHGEIKNHRGWTNPTEQEIATGPIKTEGTPRRLTGEEVTAIKSENTRRQMAALSAEERKAISVIARKNITSESIIRAEEKKKRLRESGLYKKLKPRTEQHRERMSTARSVTYYAKSPTGEVVKIDRLKPFCVQYGYSRGAMHRMLIGKREFYKKWTRSSKEEYEQFYPNLTTK